MGPSLTHCVVLSEFSTGNSPTLLLRLAINSNVAIYPFDPRGAAPVVPGGDASTGPDFGPDGQQPALLSKIIGNLSGELSARRMEQSELLEAAAVTGGRVPLDVNDALRMMREDSSYYELEYYLPKLEMDGALHRIRIKLRRSGLQVLAKDGYQAPAIRRLAK
jgi:hypothetical protein